MTTSHSITQSQPVSPTGATAGAASPLPKAAPATIPDDILEDARKVLSDIDAELTMGRLYVVARALQLAERKATEAERQRADAIVCREWNRTVVRECLMPGSPTERFVSCVLTAIRSKQEGEGA